MTFVKCFPPNSPHLCSRKQITGYDAYQVNKSLGKMMNTLFKKQPKKDMKAGKELFKGKTYKRDGAQTRIPGDFLIEKGVILEAHYGKYVGDHLPMYRLHQY